jgi:hypothetical protein
VITERGLLSAGFVLFQKSSDRSYEKSGSGDQENMERISWFATVCLAGRSSFLENSIA